MAREPKSKEGVTRQPVCHRCGVKPAARELPWRTRELHMQLGPELLCEKCYAETRRAA